MIPPRYYSPAQVAALIRASSPKAPSKRSLVVVDVRDVDYCDAKIVGSVHLPYNQLERKGLKELQTLVLQDRPSDVVFHCHLSRQRAASASSLFSQALKAHPEHGNVSIGILEGGICAWKEAYGSDPELTEPLPPSKH